jgi:hypothetical protein
MWRKLPVWANLAFGLSLANLLFLQAWGQMFGLGYFQQNSHQPFNSAALLLNVAFLTAFFTFARSWLGRCDRGAWSVVAAVLLILLLLIPLNWVRFRFHWHYPFVAELVRSPLAWILISLLLVALIMWRRPVLDGLGIAIIVLFPLALYHCSRALWITVESRPPPSQPVEAFAPRTPPKSPRVIWILFDEMDQRVVFSERPASVHLPEIDRFRQISWHAENAVSPAGNTLLSMPSLIIGKVVVDAQPVGPGDLILTITNCAARVNWRTQPNIFRDAREMKLNTAVSGWYHPYSRILAGDLTFCSWYAFPPYDGCGASNVLSSLEEQVASWSPLRWRQRHLEVTARIVADTKKFATATETGLFLGHVPIPHYPGIYDPETHQASIATFDVAKSYLNNLALVDRTLGELRQAMEGAGTWESSTVVVTSDHWWRQANQLDGKTDHRVPLLIKLARQTNAVTYWKPLNTVVLRDLMRNILQQKISTPGEISQWFDRNN